MKSQPLGAREGANNTVLQLDFLCWTTRDRFRVFRMKLSLVFPSWLASATLPKQLPACSTLSNKLTRIEEAALPVRTGRRLRHSS
jgi:hypothetical protein